MYNNIPQLHTSLESANGNLPRDVTMGDIATAVHQLPRRERVFVEKHWGLKPRTRSLGLRELAGPHQTYFEVMNRRNRILLLIHGTLLSHSQKKRETV